MPKSLRAFFLFAAVVCALRAPASITSTSLRIQGSGLRIVNPTVVAGVDLPSTVQTEFGGKQNDEAVALEGVAAVGELTGPGIDPPIQLTTAPGHAFQIPGLAQQGIYYLQNVRLMKGSEFLQYASPSTAVITVADLLQTKVSVQQLTPDELRRRGISVDARNYNVYEYSFSFLIDGKTVVIPYPVVVDRRTHEVQPIVRETPYALPPIGLTEPPRWSPPQIIAMDFGEDQQLPEPGKDPVERTVQSARPSIPAAIVIPNSLAVLHQFFAVAIMVTNGAPEGSAPRLEDIKATIHIPTALRTVKTTPQVSFGQPVPVVEPTTGVTFLVAQARGEAEWTLEGLEPGTHRIDFDLRAVLRQPGQVDLPMRATPSASIVVHDPRFNINFSHPDTVRKGVEYSTVSFITNMSPTDQTIVVTSGIESCAANPNANVCRLNGAQSDSLTIPAGDMRLIEYRLRAGTTGHVFATAGTIGDTDNITASVRLHMGVSETGIPLSPATLLLPHYAQYVHPDLISANLTLLGLGYSLATSPLNQMTARFPRVIKTDVFQRAVDMARAGQRIFITDSSLDQKRDAISHLALDLLGNGGYELREWDQLRRQEKSGRAAGASVIRELESIALGNGATMPSFIDAFGNATAHRMGHVAALAHGAATGERPYAIALIGRTTGRRTDIPNEAASDWVRNLPYSDISRFNGAGESGELALVGRWTEDVDLQVTPAADGPFQLDVLYPDTNDGALKRAHFAFNGTASQTITIHLTRGANALEATFANNGIAATATINTITPAALKVVGARQDLYLDPDGHKVSVLFNRPIKVETGVDLRTKFTGRIDFNRDSVVYQAPRPISAAALQDDGRIVNTTFDHALSQNATYTIAVGSLLDPLNDQSVSFADPTAPKIDNDAPAGIVYGKVIKGDNTPVAGADVTIRQYLPNDPSPDPQGTPQYDVSQSDGAFLFEFVRRQIDAGWSGTYRLEGFSTASGKASVDGSVRLPGKVHFVNLQYLGRGAAQGVVRYNDGSIVAGATVTVGSTMFSQFRTATTDALGRYRVEDLPVGPLTFSATDAVGNVTFAANEVATPGQLVTQDLSIFRQPFPGIGTVYGVVRRSDTNAPMAGIHVGVYSQGYGLTDGFTDANGRFEFTKVPAGFVTVLAEDWVVARQSVAVDVDLKANETKAADLLFFIASDAKFATLTGEVWRENPLQPGVTERVPGALVKIAGYRVVTADADGKFTFDNLPLAFSGRAITAYDPATQRLNSATVPSLTEAGPNNVAIFINAFSRGTGTVRVRLLNAAGQPVPGYRVIVPGFPARLLDPAPQQPGVYELKNVAVGELVQIVAVPSGPRPPDGVADSRPYGDQMARGSARIEFNGHIAALPLRLPGEGTVRVKVRTQFDLIAPVRLTYPVWYEGEQSTVPQTLEASTEKNGIADRAVFTKIPALTNYTAESSHLEHGYAAATSMLAFDGEFKDELLQLNTLATVRGTVYAIDGVTPIAGATVSIANGLVDPGPQVTGPDGRFEFADQPSAVNITVTAQVTQSGIYRIGFSSAQTPANGGVVDNMAVVLRKRGVVDGQVVYANYKRYDPDNVANNIPDDTPNDYSDNAPVPLARFYLRELDFPGRTFGRSTEPLVADVAGRFVINNVFVGSLRASAWDPGNEELRGDWTGRIDEEGAEASPKAYIAITGGGGGVGAARITVVDPNQAYAAVQNAEVSLYAGGAAFDFGSTDATGSVEFTELPTGTYAVSAYSKALGKTSKTEFVVVPKDNTGAARLELEFSGEVDGTLVDPENADAPVPGSVVRLTASNYQTQSSTNATGFFLFKGVREGTFALDAKDILTNRRAHADRTLSVLDPHRTVKLELEPIETLHFAAYLPDDFGNKSDVLAGPAQVEVTQRCYRDLGGDRHCDYERQLQGNPLQFPGVLENSDYGISVWQPGSSAQPVALGGHFPTGTATNPIVYVYPAYGEVRITVTQGGAPANGARVTVSGGGASFVVYTDSSGEAVVRNLRLGPVYVQAASIDGKFTGGTSTTILRQSVAATAAIALGTYAGVTGYVEAEAGGPSIGTRVVANYAGNLAEIRTDSTGHYTFLGIPTPGSGGTVVNLTFIGPDDTTVGATTSRTVQTGDSLVEAPSVKLDATAPQLESIIPADGALNVSPDANISITFSEPLSASNINGNKFQLIDSDTGAVNCALTSTTLANGKFVVTMTPPHSGSGLPLRSNTLYRVIVAGSVTDLTGHPLPASRGFTFTTSDYAEPRVQKVLPASPIPASTAFEFRFNEPIDPAPWAAGGNGVFHIYKLAAPGGANAGIVSTLQANAFLDPTNMTLFISPKDGNPILPESFYRVVFSGVRDPQGNTLAEQTYHFYSFDEVAPHVVFAAPAVSEPLVSGSEYELRVELHNGSPTGSIATDISKVEYFTVVNDVERPFAAVTQAPFSTRVLGPEAPVGGANFTVGAQAYDASGNRGPKTRATWTVKPNAAPTNVIITPSVASAYPSRTFTSVVTFSDEGSFATVTMTVSVPRNNGTTQTTNVTQSYTRAANGTWPRVQFSHVLPNDAKAGEHATLTVTVSDVLGLTSAPATATVDIAADTIQPNILSVTPAAGTSFVNKALYTIEAIVSDAETAVQSVTFLVDGDTYATASQTTGPTAGTQKFRSVPIEVKSKAEDAQVPIVVTAKDFNGNTRSTTHDLFYQGVNDPAAPKVTWLCPVDRGALPALASNFALKLRLNVVDEDIRSVRFRIGATTTIDAALLGGTEYGATYTFPQTPAAGPLTITAVVEDTVAAHTIELPITLDLVNVDFTWTDPKAITAVEAPALAGKSIALLGTGAVLAPQVPLTLANLLVLNGARVETLPSTITREFKVDLTTTGITYVDCDSTITVSEKGYLGGWGTSSDGQNANFHGLTAGNTNIGGADNGSQGSHGGVGGNSDNTFFTNATYGSITQPTDLGAGGGGRATCCDAGASGGGAISLHGGHADNDLSRVVIGGAVRADGGHGTPPTRVAAGAGGSVWLDAKQVVLGTLAQLSANGGDDDGLPIGTWGAGGGRIAIAATTKLELANAIVEARGGRGTVAETNTAGDGGAGTIYVRKPGQERGELTVSALDRRVPGTAHYARPTPLGRIGTGTSTAIAANTLVDATRTFDAWMIGEELLVNAHAFTVIGITSDGKGLKTDPADGSLLDVASSQSVAYTGMLVFDKVTAGPRSLLVFDDQVDVDGAVDDKSAMTIDATAAVVLRNEGASLTLNTTPAEDADLIRDTTLALTYTAAVADGVGRVTFRWSPEAAPRIETFNDFPKTTPSHTLTLGIPPTAPLGIATLAIEITDRAGRTYTMPSRTFHVITNTEPVITSVVITPGTAIHAGRDVTATVTTSDDVAVKTVIIDAKLNGVSVQSQTFAPNAKNATSVFTVNIAPTIAGGSTLRFDITASDAFLNRAPTTTSQTVSILTDTGKPQITVNAPTANATFKESSVVPVRVIATDAEVAVKEATAQLNGANAVALQLVNGEWRADLVAPPVDGDESVQRSLTITAKDYAGNSTVTDAIPLTIEPVIDPNAPALSWTCATSGAMFVAGTDVKLRVTALAANAQNPVQTVSFVVDDAATPIAATSIGNNQFEATFSIPSTDIDGRTHNVRAIARSAGGATSDLLTTFSVVVPNTIAITANTLIDTTNTTYENKTVVVQSGTVTIRGPHTFDRLLILGGTVTHAATEKLDLTTTRGTYVSCDGAIDATARGYAPATSYPGATVTAVNTGSGGTHIGIGGIWNGNGSTFGSITRPQESGGGGDGTAGGGTLRLRTQSIVVDGAIRANGGDGGAGNGAGGSIWLTSDRIGGAGTIEANGGVNAGCCKHSGGGGGAVAIEFTDATSTLPLLHAQGGSSANTRHGGAGSIFIKNPNATFGSVTIDNAGLAGNAVELPSLGNGRIVSISGATLLTDRTTDISPYFAGHWIDVFAPNGTRRGTWRIASTNAKSITLQPNNNETITAAAGDTWRGVYLFDTIQVRSSTVRTIDDLRATRDVDATSTLTVNDAPEVNAALIAVASQTGGDFVVGTAGAVSDAHPPIVVTATNKRTAISFSANANADGSFSVPVTGDIGDTFTLRARDSFTMPATSASIDVARSIGNTNAVAQVTIERTIVTGGVKVAGAVRMLNPVTRAAEGIVTLVSSSTKASVPNTITIPIGATSIAFEIATTTVTTTTSAIISATNNGTTRNATLSLVSAGVLSSIVLTPSPVEGGTTANGTVALSAIDTMPSSIALFSSDNTLLTVPTSVIIPAGSLETTFSILTSKVAASTSATITAVYGNTKSATLPLTACAAIGTVDAPASAPLTNVWIDDALPPNATSTGNGTFVTTQKASGTSSIALAGAASWTANALTFSVAPSDNLVLYALVNPCNPPREILVTWSDGTNTYRASWGEDLIDATLAHLHAGAIPAGGTWIRLEVLAARLFTSTRTIQSLSVRTNGGELWIDRIGTNTCSLTPHVAAPASSAPYETMLLDDALPSGVISARDPGGLSWVWDTTQSASGTASHVEPLAPGLRSHYYYNDPNPITIDDGDVLYTYVLLDPCNPPREVMLLWNDGSTWNHAAWWGEDLISTARTRVGALPATGQWVRLEVPAAAVGLNNRKVYGMSFALYDGRAWFDRSGKYGRVNLALNHTATQSTTLPTAPASLAVDGDVVSHFMSVTQLTTEPWWQVDLGESAPMIDSIEIRGRTDCCLNQTAEITAFVSDFDFSPSLTLAAARALNGVGIYRSQNVVGSTYTIGVGRRGRYVRLWRTGTDHLSLPEVMVWAPASAARINLAAGRRAFAPPSQTYLSYFPEHATNGSATDTFNTTGSIFHSNGSPDAYWQVDLGQSQPISTIDISARTDCCPEQLTGYYVLASDQPFDGDALAPYLADSRVSVWWVGTMQPVKELPINRSARYIRLQRVGSDALVFTEVRVWSQQANTQMLLRARRPE